MSKLSILQHSLGVDQHGRGEMYRDHFVTGPGSLDYETCVALAADGLMTHYENKHVVGGNVFIVTEAGKQFVRDNSPAAPKLTRSAARYQRWHDSGAADCGWSFGDWLKSGRASS